MGYPAFDRRGPGAWSSGPRLRGLLAAVGFSALAAFSQGIRKNYTEMTAAEKIALVDAFYALGPAHNSGSFIEEMALFHNQYFNASSGGIHFADEENQNVFHAWHRYAAWEVEQEMQKLNPHITLPYWDWTVNSSPSDELWSQTFLGQFNSAWSLGRTMGRWSLPSATDVAAIQSIGQWWVDSQTGYVAQSEGGVVHGNPHLWVGGEMGGNFSPRDPVFWLHHNGIDRLWQEWEDQEPQVKTYHTKTTMPRYDGTFTRPWGNVQLPAVDPDAISDSRALGIFYAANGLARLDKYAVTNAARNPEQFTYKYLIQAADFTVPAGKQCNFRSATGIELQSGFTVESGGTFTADIVPEGSILAKAASERESPETRPEAHPMAAAGKSKLLVSARDERLYLEFPEALEWSWSLQGEIWNVAGKRTTLPLVATHGTYRLKGVTFGLKDLAGSGVHFYRIRVGKNQYSGKVMLPRK